METFISGYYNLGPVEKWDDDTIEKVLSELHRPTYEVDTAHYNRLVEHIILNKLRKK